MWFGLYIAVIITSIDLSRELVAIDMLRAVEFKSSLDHCRKHCLRWLRLYEGQAYFQNKKSFFVGNVKRKEEKRKLRPVEIVGILEFRILNLVTLE